MRTIPALLVLLSLTACSGEPPGSKQESGAQSSSDAIDGVAKHSPARPSGAFQALDEWTRRRAYPEADIPAKGVQEAFESHPREVDRPGKRASDRWVAAGPHNVGGRMLTVAYNPENTRTVWAGSASGGLWRSYSGGEGADAWHRVETGFPVLAASAIVFAPGDSSRIWLGTGEVYNRDDRDGRGVTYRPSRGSYGLGILRSLDGGQTWEQSLDWTAEQGRGVQMLTVNPLRPETIWAATTEGTLVTYNGGDTWSMANPVVMATDVAIHPADTTRILAAHGNLNSEGNGLYRSLDSGATWTRMTEGLPTSYGGKALISFAPSDPSLAYATIGGGFTSSDPNWLVRTQDGGDTWNTMTGPSFNFVGSQGWYSHDVAVDPNDPSRLTVLGFLIHRSPDAGRLLEPATVWEGWTVPFPSPSGEDNPANYTHPDHHAFAVHPDNPQEMLFATDGGIYRTRDGANSFEALVGGLQTAQFYAGMATSVHDTLTVLAGTQDNSTLLYRGSTRWRILNGGDGAWTATDPDVSWRYYWSSQYLAMRRSSNRGTDSESIRPPGTERPTGFVAPFVVSPADGRKLYAGRDRVYASIDRGNNWGTTNAGQPLTGEPLVSLAASHQSQNVVYALTAPGSERGRAFRTDNGGVTWADITGSLPDRYLVDITVDPNDDRRVFVAVAGFGSPHIYGSTDGGQTWTARDSGLPDLPTWAVLVDPEYPDTLFAGNDLGVFRSDNGGVSWEAWSDGLGEAIIAMDLAISPGNRMLHVATHGNGMYSRRLPAGRSSEPSETPVEIAPGELSVFPNPADDRATVLYGNERAQRVRIDLYDAVGRLVQTLADEEMPSGSRSLEAAVTGLPAGVYYVVARSPEAATTRTLVVRH